ncbi:MAG: MoxR family ATPase [Ignavibacteria bacterium]|nr:MoxR family ATPase [Ignavibacteria bacterium]
MFKNDVEAVEALSSSIKNLKKEIKKVIVGQDEIIENLLIALLSKGHCLLIGVPGLAKTLLIKTLAQALDLKFSRIQFTPDLMPSDITGTEILEIDTATNQRVFKFVKGPIFTNILLADEINRTPPKTQSALLEAMQELQVTAAGNKYPLEEPFFVLATQNPIEQEGTYPLPEAQLDRFMFNLWLDYPSKEEEIEIVKTTTSQYTPEVNKVLNSKEIKYFQELVRRVPVADNVIEYAVKLTNATRPVDGAIKFVKDNVSWGAGPRASQFMIIAAKARSVINGSFTPSIDDVKSVALPILRHRIIPTFSAEADGITSADIIQKILEQIN